MAITAATPEQFDDFLSVYGYTVADTDKSRLLALSLTFLQTVDICVDGDTYTAQCFIAYAMSSEGGGFNPTAVADGKTLTKKSLGRNAITKEWEVNSELSGSDSTSLLKRIPMAYALLKPLLCSNTGTVSAGSIGNIEVLR